MFENTIYIKYFDAVPNVKYENKKTKFKSYFLTFSEGARLELMKREGIQRISNEKKESLGYAHLAISVGSEAEVIRLTKQLKEDGFKVVGEARLTGDGYFESVILDPDGNRIEIIL